jgi:hypothetical protein
MESTLMNARLKGALIPDGKGGYHIVQAKRNVRGPVGKVLILIFALLVAVIMALSKASATDIGTIVWFNKHLGTMGGCTEMEDAETLRSFGTDIVDDWKIQRYVALNSLELDTSTGRVSGCTIVNRNPKERWKIVNKLSVNHPTSAWFCVESIEPKFDYGEQPTTQTSSFEDRTPCFWVFLLDKPSRR